MGSTGPEKCHNLKVPSPDRRSPKQKKTMSGRGKKPTIPKELYGEKVAEVHNVKLTFAVDKTKRCNAPSKSMAETKP